MFIPCVCRQPKETRRGLEIRLDSLDGAAGSCETANMGAGNQTGILWNRTELSQTAKLFLRNQCFRPGQVRLQQFGCEEVPEVGLSSHFPFHHSPAQLTFTTHCPEEMKPSEGKAIT